MTSRSRGAILLCEFGEFRLVQRSKPNLAVPYRKILKLNSNCELDVCSFFFSAGAHVFSKLITVSSITTTALQHQHCRGNPMTG